VDDDTSWGDVDVDADDDGTLVNDGCKPTAAAIRAFCCATAYASFNWIAPKPGTCIVMLPCDVMLTIGRSPVVVDGAPLVPDEEPEEVLGRRLLLWDEPDR
jgi:hypothetical protein